MFPAQFFQENPINADLTLGKRNSGGGGGDGKGGKKGSGAGGSGRTGDLAERLKVFSEFQGVTEHQVRK